MTLHEKLLAMLDARGVVYDTHHHEPTYTSADASRIRQVSLHEGAKALVIRGAKSKTHYLFVMPADLRLDSKKVSALIGEKFSFAPDPEAVCGCVPGSVPPFGSLLGLCMFCDHRLSENTSIHFNAASLTDSVTMTYADYLRVENPTLVDCTA